MEVSAATEAVFRNDSGARGAGGEVGALPEASSSANVVMVSTYRAPGTDCHWVCGSDKLHLGLNSKGKNTILYLSEFLYGKPGKFTKPECFTLGDGERTRKVGEGGGWALGLILLLETCEKYYNQRLNHKNIIPRMILWDFPDGPVVENPQCREHGFESLSEKIPHVSQATKHGCHNYEVCALETRSCNY